MKNWLIIFFICGISNVSAQYRMWGINSLDASNPVILFTGDETIYPLDHIGPVFKTEEGEIGPGKYETTLKKHQFKDDYEVLECEIQYNQIRYTYTLRFRIGTDNSLEMIAEGENGLASFSLGKVTGSVTRFQQFNEESDLERTKSNEYFTSALFLPDPLLYIYAVWDRNFSHALIPETPHFFNGKTVTETPVAPAPVYSVMDPLKERFIFVLSEED